MPVFEQGDIVRVPFPYTDRNTRQHRPALVVSDGGIGAAGGLLWVVMITSAENQSWPGDCALGDSYRDAGLPAPSIIRSAKIATIESRDADPIGRLSPRLMAEVLHGIRRNLSLQSTAMT